MPTKSIDVKRAWRQVHAAALRAKSDKTVISSVVQRVRYRVGKVDDNAITLDRLDATAQEKLTRTEVESLAAKLNAAGGTIRRRKLHYTVAKETAFVYLHPAVQWSKDGQRITISDDHVQTATAKPARSKAPATRDPYSTAELAALTPADYVNALQTIDLYLRDKEMLLTNYHAPDRTITAKQMATVLGFSAHGAANLRYGRLAKRVGDHLGIHPDHAELWVLITMSWPRKECEWTLRPQLVAALESMGWVDGLHGILPEEVEGDLVEGAVVRVSVNAYERNTVARQKCVQHYGPTCVICGFNFAKRYGSVVDGLIHVHHVRPLSELGGEYKVDPVRDLRPVCPNCHAVLHSRRPGYSVDDVRKFIKKRGR